MSHTAHASAPVLKMGVPIPNGKLGMWLFLGTEIMFFTAFIGTYIVLRLGSPGWPTDTHVTHIVIWAGAINTFVLICSSVSVVLAHEAMGIRDFKRATNWIAVTTVLSFVFLGIKAYEYYGKFAHDILPGHVAESPQQALDKMVRELDAASGLPPLKKQLEQVKNSIALSKGGSESLNAKLDGINKQIEALTNVDMAYKTIKAEAKAGTLSLTEARGKLLALKQLFTKDDLEFEEHHDSVRKEVLAAKEQGTAELQKAILPEDREKLLKDFPGRFGGVHDPHVIVYGNIFSSTYFLMTGFHALHVIIGIGMFAGIIALGVSNKLNEHHSVLVENCGLYWHFVDLVWIFLFPLIYIV